MDQEIYAWIEQYTGVSYDFDEPIKNLSGMAFIDPFEWYIGIDNILSQLREVIEIIDEYGDELPSELPAKSELKIQFAENIVNKLIGLIDDVEGQLNITSTNINSYDDLSKHLQTIKDLLDMLIHNTSSDIIQKHMFENYDEENDNVLTETFNLREGDMTNMQFIVNDVRQSYFDSLEYKE